MENKTEKRWLSVYVENEVGVLARVAGLFSGKLYNLNSLTVGETEQSDTSRMTISLFSDDRTFEQVKHQLNNMVEVIQVVDYTQQPFHAKEVMYVKITNYSEMEPLLLVENEFTFSIVDSSPQALIIESLANEQTNDRLMQKLQQLFPEGMEVVRGGSVALTRLHSR
ncbi:acetolactate synthase small subunit [Enterococcus sp. AZ072]|uniref:acetolactate synthase small subunit n=1 Tax=unclassified Enterococcus TaxID=2608891 RepID=UPI003D2BA0BC